MGTMGVTMSWLWVCSSEAPASGAHVLEDHPVDQSGVLLEVHQPVAVDPEDLPDLLLGEFRGADQVLGGLDDDLVGPDAPHHVVDAVPPLVEVPLDFQGRELVGDHADPPPRAIPLRARVAIGDDLVGGLVLVPFAEGAETMPPSPRRGLEVVRPFGAALRDDHPAADDRVFAQVRHVAMDSVQWGKG